MAAHLNGLSLEELFARYLGERDERAIAALVKRVRPRLLSVARRIGNRADAEDSVQTAFLSLVHRQGPFHAPVLPWLITAVVRTAYAAKAARDKQVLLAERLARVPVDPSPSVVGAAIGAEEAERLRARVDRLPAKYRDAVVLHYFQGLSTSEAALLLCVSQPAVKKRLERARRLLRADHPRVAGLALAVPWALHDAAAFAAAAGGGLLMSKNIAVLGCVLLLGLGGSAIWMTRDTPARDRATRVEPAEGPAAAPTSASTADKKGGLPAKAAEDGKREGLFGVVVDPAGNPVADARVVAWWGKRGFAPTTTGRDGRFVLRPGGYLAMVKEVPVHVVADGFARAMVKLHRDQGARIVLGKGGVLRVVVRGDEGAVAAAPVWLCDGTKPLPRNQWQRYAYLFEQKTDANGVVEFSVAAGRYRPCVRAPGLVPQDGEPVDVVVGETVKATFAVGQGTTFDITVEDDDGQPVAGADVEVRGPLKSGGRGKTDERGRILIGGIAPPSNDPAPHSYASDRVSWHVEAPGFAARFSHRPAPRQAGREVLTVKLRRGVPVRLRVVDRRGNPVSAEVNGVYARRTGGTLNRRFGGKTDEHGWIDLGAHGSGEREVWVRATGYVAHGEKFRVGTKAVSRTVRLTRADVVLRGVVLLPDGRSASQGTISIRLAGRKTSVSARGVISSEGEFELKGVPEGALEVGVLADNFVEQVFPMDVEAGMVRESMTLTLRAGAELRGRVVSREGRNLAGVSVALEQQIEKGAAVHIVNRGKTVSSADGTFRFLGLGPKKYRMRARSDAWRPVAVFGQEVRGGEDVVVEMKPASEPSGIALLVRVTSENDRKIEGRITMQYLVNGRNWIAYSQRRRKGGLVEFSFPNPAGTYDLKFTAPGHIGTTVRGVRIVDQSDPSPIDVQLSRGAVVRLRCLDAQGKPLTGLSVACWSQQVRTGPDGICEISGLEPGPVDLRVHQVGAHYVRGRARLRAPGRADVVLRRYGSALIKLPEWTYADVEGSVVYRLRKGDEIVEKKSVEPGPSYPPKSSILTFFSVTEPGLYTVEVMVNGKRAEAAVTIRLGERSPVSLDPR